MVERYSTGADRQSALATFELIHQTLIDEVIDSIRRSPGQPPVTDAQRLRALLNDANAGRRADARVISSSVQNPAPLHQMLEIFTNPANVVASRRLIEMLGNEQTRARATTLLDLLASPRGSTTRADGLGLLAMLNDTNPAKRQLAQDILAIENPQRRHEVLDLARAPAGQSAARDILDRARRDGWTEQTVAMLGMWSWLRGLFRASENGPSSDLVPHIDGQRFTVPIGGQVSLSATNRGVMFFDGASGAIHTPNLTMERTERGWIIRSAGSGFHHQPAGSNQFTLVPPGTSVRIGANDQIRLGADADANILTFRSEQGAVAPALRPGEPQMRLRTEGRLRTLDIVRPDGTSDRVQLICSSGWLGVVGPDGPHQSPVKIHINVQNAADLARLQPVVIDALINDPVLSRLVSLWKTMDPAYALGEQARAYGAAPTGQGQEAKGFTIYCANAEDAFLIQQRLSQIIAERGLALPAPLNSGNIDSLDRTNRVGLVRDTWPITSDAHGRRGFLLDAALSHRIRERYHLGDGQFLSVEQRRQIERELGLRVHTLTYDRSGRLMLRATNTDNLQYHGAAYADESRARTPEGLADRAALYALYRRFRVDPAQEARSAFEHSAAFTRRAVDYSTMVQAQLDQAAQRLEVAFSNRSVRTGLMSDAAMQSFIAQFRSRSQSIFAHAGADARASAIQSLVRDMVARPGLQIGINPDQIVVEASAAADGSGRQLVRHAGGAGQPAVEGTLVGRQGDHLQIRLAAGEVVSRPVAGATLVIQVPEAQLRHASSATAADGTPFTRAAASEVMSTVYRFLAQADAVMNGRAPAGTSVGDLGRMAELSAQRLEYELNARRLTPNHTLPAVALAQVDVARVISSPQPRGVIHGITENGVMRYELVEGRTRRSLTTEERERVERQLNEHFERVYSEAIRNLQRSASDASLSEAEQAQSRLALDAIRADLALYRASPHRRAEVHTAVPRAGGDSTGWRGQLGTGTRVVSGLVIMMILAETARSMLSRTGSGGALPVVPVR